MKQKRVVVCEKCAFLVFVQGMEPMCLERAVLVDSPLRKHVDIRGIRLATKSNPMKACKKKKLFSFRALKLRIWARKDCHKKGLTWFGGKFSAYLRCRGKCDERQAAGAE